MSIVTVSPLAPTGHAVPTTGPVGFKDWNIICEALGRGRQSLILRKGGIAEGRAGFRFKHDRFFLFPTGFHQQFDKVHPGERLAPETPIATGAENVEVRYLFALDFAHWVEDWDCAARLAPFHIWREEVIRERFEYGEQSGLQCAFGRVYRCEVPWVFPNLPGYGGCRSWVTLPETPANLEMAPVLDEWEHAQRRTAIETIVQPI